MNRIQNDGEKWYVDISPDFGVVFKFNAPINVLPHHPPPLRPKWGSRSTGRIDTNVLPHHGAFDKGIDRQRFFTSWVCQIPTIAPCNPEGNTSIGA